MNAQSLPSHTKEDGSSVVVLSAFQQSVIVAFQINDLTLFETGRIEPLPQHRLLMRKLGWSKLLWLLVHLLISSRVLLVLLLRRYVLLLLLILLILLILELKLLLLLLLMMMLMMLLQLLLLMPKLSFLHESVLIVLLLLLLLCHLQRTTD